MDPVQLKLYHVDTFHSRNFIDTYFANEPGHPLEEEGLKLPMEKLHYFFKFANVKGDTMIDISLSSFFHHLYSACEYFKEIILLKFNDHCILELKKWLHDRTGAFDWKHASSFIVDKEGKSGQAETEEKEKRLKEKIKHVLKCYIDKENIVDPLQLQPADCLCIGVILQAISKDEDDYIRNLNKFTKLLKPGGLLLYFGVLNATYFKVGDEKFHLLKCEESFLRKALEGEGYDINHWDIHPRKVECDLTDFKALIFVTARKKE